MKKKLTHFSLFTGIGGIDLAAEWAGFETIGQCEWADYPTKILEKHWPHIPRWRDIRDVTEESVRRKNGFKTINLISGGFPCQPFSIAGERKGKEDDRYLWPEMVRVVSELKPVWVIGENVPNILNMGIEECLLQLEDIGYTGGVFLIPASAVGARFKGNRVFIACTSDSKRWGGVDESFQINPSSKYLKSIDEWETRQNNLPLDMEGFFTNPSSGVKRNDDGISEGVDRLKCLGNAVVPQHIYPILKAIAEIEKRS